VAKGFFFESRTLPKGFEPILETVHGNVTKL